MSDRFYNTAPINIKCAELDKNITNKVITWIILTSEYGKPSDEYVDDFINTFYDSFKNGHKPASNIGGLLNSNNVKYNDNGNSMFYDDVCHKSMELHKNTVAANEVERNKIVKSQLKTWILGYNTETAVHYNSNNIVCEVSTIFNIDKANIDESGAADTVVITTTSSHDTKEEFIETYEEMVEEYYPINWDDLKGDVRLDIRGNEGDGRDFKATVVFNKSKKMYTMLSGGKIANKPTKDCPKIYINRVQEFGRQGKMNKETRIFSSDLLYMKPDELIKLITLSNDYCKYVFIEGTDFTLGETLSNEMLYSNFIGEE